MCFIEAYTYQSVLIMYYVFSPLPLQSYNEFWRDYRQTIVDLGYPLIEALRQAGYVYDAVWLAAFALHEVDMQLKAGELPGRTSLLSFNYTETEINKLIYKAARNKVFRGVTVRIFYLLEWVVSMCLLLLTLLHT